MENTNYSIRRESLLSASLYPWGRRRDNPAFDFAEQEVLTELAPVADTDGSGPRIPGHCYVDVAIRLWLLRFAFDLRTCLAYLAGVHEQQAKRLLASVEAAYTRAGMQLHRIDVYENMPRRLINRKIQIARLRDIEMATRSLLVISNLHRASGVCEILAELDEGDFTQTSVFLVSDERGERGRIVRRSIDRLSNPTIGRSGRLELGEFDETDGPKLCAMMLLDLFGNRPYPESLPGRLLHLSGTDVEKLHELATLASGYVSAVGIRQYTRLGVTRYLARHADQGILNHFRFALTVSRPSPDRLAYMIHPRDLH
ncbi:hypothetical protein [Paraburkholderia caribensis]|uniref:hypothetical protein n=1 Tax=Paraburkholderia caribensis TaxID=75105 RepID=UPI001CAEED03|nr:hypothetical protein [Paraburkholderia caribensis]CAG9250936.1 hypothetical protein PCAR4_290068 [Paraburkholderia caribensis]